MQNRNSLKDEWLRKLRNRMRLANLAWKTEQSYVRTVSVFWDAATRMPKEWSRERKVEEWLSHLVRRYDVSASTQNCRFNALVYFFRHVVGEPLKDVNALRAKRKATMRVSVDRATTLSLLEAVPNVGGYATNFIARLIYGCGLRVTEPLNLRMKDVDFGRSRLTLWETKGDKCRVVPLPCSLVVELRAQMEFAHAMWRRDVRAGIPIALPGALDRKYPSRVHAAGWFRASSRSRSSLRAKLAVTVAHEKNPMMSVALLSVSGVSLSEEPPDGSGTD